MALNLMRSARTFLVVAAAVAVISSVAPVFGEPALDRVLSEINVTDAESCAVVKIAFHFPVQYVSHLPLESGAQLRVRLRPTGAVSPGSAVGREELRAPQSTIANISRIEYEGDRSDGPTLTVTFNRPMYYQVSQGRDLLTLLISVSDSAASSNCAAAAHSEPRAAVGAAPVFRSATAMPDQAAAAPMEPDPAQQKVLDQARALIIAKDYPRAIDLLTNFFQEPRNASVHAARELLGVARERSGQVAQAKAEYERFLRDYPNDPGVERVKQRLAALMAGSTPSGAQNALPAPELSAPSWQANASLSEFYLHDEMSTSTRDDVRQITIDNGSTSLQSEFISTLDATVGVTGATFTAKLRATGSYTKDFLTGLNDRLRIGELYLEGSDASGTLSARVGRQYRSSGGVLGRIDGGVVSVRLDDQFKIDFVGGFPVDASYSPFGTHRYAYGASLDYAQGPFSAAIYTLRQIDDGLVDRQSIGGEGRYIEGTLSAFATLDYDVHFNHINLALFNGNYVFADQTSVSFAADYRRAPLLRTSDALIGQRVSALSDLLTTYTRSEIDQLALDRTATSTSLFASVGHPLNEIFSASVDATLWDMSGMPASGGVAAFPSTGTQYYFSGHLIGSGILTDGDLGVLGIGYAKMYNSNRYTLDLNTRYPITSDLRVGPRLFFSYRDISPLNVTHLPGDELTARPTLRLNYRFLPNVEFELEGGAEWQREILAASTTQTLDYLVDFGVQIDL